jgi:hypothetical protein
MVLPGPAYRGHKVEYWRRKWPSKECPALFDECDHKQKDAFQLEPQDAKKLASKERAEAWRVAKAGGSVIHLGSPAKRHANLASTMADYNEQWGSYTNNNTLSRTLRGLRSLNIPRETIELRNSMIDNLQRDFSRPDSTMAA